MIVKTIDDNLYENFPPKVKNLPVNTPKGVNTTKNSNVFDSVNLPQKNFPPNRDVDYGRNVEGNFGRPRGNVITGNNKNVKEAAIQAIKDVETIKASETKKILDGIGNINRLASIKDMNFNDVESVDKFFKKPINDLIKKIDQNDLKIDFKDYPNTNHLIQYYRKKRELATKKKESPFGILLQGYKVKMNVARENLATYKKAGSNIDEDKQRINLQIAQTHINYLNNHFDTLSNYHLERLNQKIQRTNKYNAKNVIVKMFSNNHDKFSNTTSPSPSPSTEITLELIELELENIVIKYLNSAKDRDLTYLEETRFEKEIDDKLKYYVKNTNFTIDQILKHLNVMTNYFEASDEQVVTYVDLTSNSEEEKIKKLDSIIIMKNYYDLLTDENKKRFLELSDEDKINIVKKFYENKNNQTDDNQENKDKDEDEDKDEVVIKEKTFLQKYMIVIIIVVLLLLGVVGYFMFAGKSSSDDSGMDF